MNESTSKTPSGADRAAVRVRTMRREDMPHVWELIQGLADYEKLRDLLTGSQESISKLLFDESGGLEGMVAEYDDRIVGYALTYPVFSSFRTARVLWLEDLYVEPAARGTGAGLALFREVARDAVARGCIRVDWFVLDWNALAIDFYERNGGRKVEVDWLTYSLGGEALQRVAQGGG